MKKQGTDSDNLCGIDSDGRENGTDVCINYYEDSHEHLKDEPKGDSLDVRPTVSFITPECLYFFFSAVLH